LPQLDANGLGLARPRFNPQLLRQIDQPNPREHNQPLIPDKSTYMNAPSSAHSERNGTGEPTEVPARAGEQHEFLVGEKNGDAAAFESLCKQSTNMIFHIARRIVPNKEDAEDVAQETFQSAFIHLRTFKCDSRLSTWLSSSAINVARMKLRKNRVRRELPLAESSEAQQQASHLGIANRGLNPEQLYLQEERRQILSAAINELTPRMRRAIELHELEERSSQETARLMGISVGAVKGRVFHGRRKLLVS
jgi:RNA polymerase sigma-70 factor, ECF subfamily